ncbi:DWNN domain [Macleaya cordata]|uniref:DWNN domain n=1 Tax=Macleaya cordata TaxID=56857 RepID=A0A200R803_MACCD|nr:DWNN domain [Macleaya cordata]
MAVYYKFKSAKDYHSVHVDGLFISVFNLKEQIFESKHFGMGKDFDLIVSDAQTNEEYLDDAMIPRNTSVIVRRVPGWPRKPIVVEPKEAKVKEHKVEDAQPATSNFAGVDSSVSIYPGEMEWDEFVNDLYDLPKVLPVQLRVPVQDSPLLNKADEDSKIKAPLLNKAVEDSKTENDLLNKDDEDSKIKALVDTPALDWQQQSQEGFGTGRGFGRGGMGGRLIGGRGFGTYGGFERKTPPEGYVCHRCQIPGHFIQHCPTNGDPNYDVKRLKRPTGIPKSMLTATQDGSYALPSGAVAVFKPNEAVFEKEIEGLPSARPVINIPPELRCPLCKEVMKDAVLTSKCCFQSFCDKCIRGNIISKSMCICGATSTLADDLIPNKTLRDTINSILESNNSSSGNTRSMLKSQDTESARSSAPKVPSTTLSATSEKEKMSSPSKGNTTPDAKEMVNEEKPVAAPQHSFEKSRSSQSADISEATLESMILKEQSSAPQIKEEVPQNLPACEPGKKKKKKKTCLPVNAGDLLWGTSQVIEAENYMMPFAPSAYNPYWSGMQLGMDGYMAPYNGYMGYAPGPFDIPIGGMLPQGPFGGSQGYLLPGVPPNRDLSELCMGLNPVPPVTRREESEARKTDPRRKREIERRDQSREHFKDQEFGREVSSSADVSSMKSKPVQKRPINSQYSADENHVDHHQQHINSNNNNNNNNGGAMTKSSRAHKRSRVVPDDDDYESNNDDDERNFKRRRSWYDSKRSSRDNEDHKDLPGRSEYDRREYGRRMTTERIVLGY